MSAWKRQIFFTPFVLSLLGVALLSSFGASTGALAQQNYIAGSKPDARPVAAPRIETTLHDAAWMKAATAGVSEPLPSSLRFLNDQGDWYTPFTRPGMPGPYDVRGLHPASTVPPNPAPATKR